MYVARDPIVPSFARGRDGCNDVSELNGSVKYTVTAKFDHGKVVGSGVALGEDGSRCEDICSFFVRGVGGVGVNGVH